MSQQPSMRDGGLRRGPYGPNNPPPPPITPPSRVYDGHVEGRRAEGRNRRNRAVRQRSYAQAEAEHLAGRDRERMRSRSPIRPQNRRGEWPRYRGRSPMHREPMNSLPGRGDRRDENMRCFACNQPGHRASDCSIAQHFDRKACFRCGEPGHIARACKVRVGEVKTDAEFAADKSDSGLNGYYNDRGDDKGWSLSERAPVTSHLFATMRETQQQSSVAPSGGRYYVEDEVEWGEDDDEAPEDKHESNWNPDRLKMVREPYLGLPHFRNAKVEDVPPTVQDLRGYDYRINLMYGSKPRSQRFVNGGNGKVAPALYGSEQRHDLGLCFATFLTRKRCEMGVSCPWRHHPLSNAERAWIIEYGKKKGKEFIDNLDRWWSFPEIPVPGATMHGLGDKDI